MQYCLLCGKINEAGGHYLKLARDRKSSVRAFSHVEIKKNVDLEIEGIE